MAFLSEEEIKLSEELGALFPFSEEGSGVRSGVEQATAAVCADQGAPVLASFFERSTTPTNQMITGGEKKSLLSPGSLAMRGAFKKVESPLGARGLSDPAALSSTKGSSPGRVVAVAVISDSSRGLFAHTGVSLEDALDDGTSTSGFSVSSAPFVFLSDLDKRVPEPPLDLKTLLGQGLAVATSARVLVEPDFDESLLQEGGEDCESEVPQVPSLPRHRMRIDQDPDSSVFDPSSPAKKSGSPSVKSVGTSVSLGSDSPCSEAAPASKSVVWSVTEIPSFHTRVVESTTSKGASKGEGAGYISPSLKSASPHLRLGSPSLSTAKHTRVAAGAGAGAGAGVESASSPSGRGSRASASISAAPSPFSGHVGLVSPSKPRAQSDLFTYCFQYEVRGEEKSVEGQGYLNFLYLMREMFKGVMDFRDSITGLPQHFNVTIQDEELILPMITVIVRATDLYIVGIKSDEGYALSNDKFYAEKKKELRSAPLFSFDDRYSESNPDCTWLDLTSASAGLLSEFNRTIRNKKNLEGFQNNCKLLAFFFSEAARFEQVEQYCYIGKRHYRAECFGKLPVPAPIPISLKWMIFAETLKAWTAHSSSWISLMSLALPENKLYRVEKKDGELSVVFSASVMTVPPSTKVVPLPMDTTYGEILGSRLPPETQSQYIAVFRAVSERLEKDRAPQKEDPTASISRP